jgi:lipoate-protein ligase A
VIRAAGGRAAAYDEGCIVLDEIISTHDSTAGINERFMQQAEQHARALQTLGVDARIGEVPGEYCPGEFSVNARGAKKLIGSAQRIIRGGWLLSTVVVVQSADRLRDVLGDVYARLGLDWAPATVGAVADEAPGVRIEAVEHRLLDTYTDRYRLRPARISTGELAAATELLARHRVEGSGRPGTDDC